MNSPQRIAVFLRRVGVFVTVIGLVYVGYLVYSGYIPISTTVLPILLPLVGTAATILSSFYLQRQRLRSEREREEMLSLSNAQYEALKAYLAEMSELIIKESLFDQPRNSAARRVAQAQTMGLMMQLDASTKRVALKLIHEFQLSNKDDPILALWRIYLDHADLSGLYLPAISLRGAELRGTDLSGADLSGTDLSGADLRGADLRDADLSGADLTDANLLPYDVLHPAKLSIHNLKDKNAIPSDRELSETRRLISTELTNTNLEDATLSGTILGNTDLQYVRGLDEEQVRQAIGNPATQLPNAIRRPPNWDESIENQIEENNKPLSDQVNDLLYRGMLDKGQGNALMSEVNTAVRQLQNDNVRSAINELQAFISRVNAVMESATLTPNEGQPLINKANAVISLLKPLR